MPSSHPLYATLSPLLQACESDIQLRAQVWEQLGAQRFGLYLNDKPFVEWTWKKAAKTTVIRQSWVMFDGQACAVVRVEGPTQKMSQAHLDAEAALIGRFLELENVNQGQSAHLNEMQNRLMQLYELVRASRLMHNTISDVISEMTRAALDVLDAKGTFLYLYVSRPISACKQFPGFSEAQGLEYLHQVQLSHQPQRAPSIPAPSTGEELLLLPIRISGTIQGVLGFVDPPDRFTSFYQTLAEIVAEQAGARIEHVMLYDNIMHQQRLTTEMELARQVQMHLLPQKQPTVPGLDICGMTFPALQVGGDFYEFILNTQTFTFIVGDVSGKGLSAAMMMAMTRAILRSTASFAFALMTPEDILTQTNEDVLDDYARVTTFTTVFIGQYELDAQRRDRLVIANAGHSPVIYCPAGQVPRLLEADAPPLGVLEKISAPNHTLMLKPGDVLIVATDGFSEAENSSDEIFGYDRLLDLADQTRQLSAREIVKAFSEVATEFEKDRAQHDDRTIVVIKRQSPLSEDSTHATL
jgi:sigma-B regulation protein RsbU (phosphoserine phosphatase)